jgi:hypothetical protein
MAAADSSPAPTDADYDTFTECPAGLEPPPGAAPFRALKGGVHPGPFDSEKETFNAYVRKFIVRGINGVPMQLLRHSHRHLHPVQLIASSFPELQSVHFEIERNKRNEL